MKSTLSSFFFLLSLAVTLLAASAAAQDVVDSSPDNVAGLIETVVRTGYQVTCSAPRALGLCGGETRNSSRGLYQGAATREIQQYSGIQRLAGMIADRMEAGHVGKMKLKFKIILE